jgi:cysteine desulfurase
MNISFEGVNGHALRDSLDKICVSCSSACAKSNDPSHVLDAMRIEPSISSCAIRISPGRLTTQDEMDEAAVSIAANVARLRASR